MKKYLILIISLSLFKPITSMMQDSKDYNLINQQQINSIKNEIRNLFFSYTPPELHDKILNLMATLDFSNPHNIPFRDELVAYIKECHNVIYTTEENETPEELTKELIALVTDYLDNPIEPFTDKQDDFSWRVFYLIISGANPNTYIKYSIDTKTYSMPILNLLLDFNMLIELVPLLLIYGANPNFSQPGIEHPVILASRSQEIETLKQLISFGSNVNVTTHTVDSSWKEKEQQLDNQSNPKATEISIDRMDLDLIDTDSNQNSDSPLIQPESELFHTQAQIENAQNILDMLSFEQELDDVEIEAQEQQDVSSITELMKLRKEQTYKAHL